MGSIAIDPVNPDIIYAGTGEQHFSGDSYYGCGVLRTLDAGETWEQLGAQAYVDGGRGGGARIARVVIDRATAGSATSTTVLAASTFGLFRSTDSGRSWNLVLEGTATDLVVHPTEPAIMYAAVYGNGVYKSFDTGRILDAHLVRDEPRHRPAHQPRDRAISPRHLYASFEATVRRGSGLAMYRTTDAAASWQPLQAEGARCFYQCWYDMTIAVHPTDPLKVYFGSLLLQLSLDGGQTFFEYHNGIYVDEHLLVFDTLRGRTPCIWRTTVACTVPSMVGPTGLRLHQHGRGPVLPRHQPAPVHCDCHARGHAGPGDASAPQPERRSGRRSWGPTEDTRPSMSRIPQRGMPKRNGSPTGATSGPGRTACR